MITILAVDDDHTFLTSLALVLREQGEVLLATSRSDCERILRLRPIDVVITDFKMTDGNGLDITMTAKSLPKPPPVIVITAYADKDMAIRSANLHVFALLEKPVDLLDLKSTVARALESGKKTAQDKPSTESSHLALTTPQYTLEPTDFSVIHQNQTIFLTETEFKILFMMVRSIGRRVERDRIIEYVWGNSKTSSNLFDTHFSNLKKKLPALKTQIKSIRGHGYVFSEKG
jgi:DNA-binding response OmpR family regulator